MHQLLEPLWAVKIRKVKVQLIFSTPAGFSIYYKILPPCLQENYRDSLRELSNTCTSYGVFGMVQEELESILNVPYKLHVHT